MKATTISIWNMKGGVGKTTSTINLAYELSKMGQRTLVLDMDPQVNCTPVFADISDKNKTVIDVLKSGHVTRSCIYRSRYDNIDIIKGSSNLTENYSPEILKEALKDVQDNYSIILIDCRPSFEALTQNAVFASDLVLTPVVLDRFCFDNLKLVEHIFREAHVSARWKCFANRVRQIKSHMEIYAEVVGQNQYPFLGVCVEEHAAIANALVYRKPVRLHQSGSRAARDYIDLAACVKEVPHG